MKMERVKLRQIQMPLVHFFETSFSRTYKRDIILVEAQGGGLSGWGEITAGENPFYNEEWTGSAWPILRDYVAPRVVGKELKSAEDVDPLTRHIRGTLWRAGASRPRSGTWRRAARRPAVEEDRRRRPARDPVRGFHRDSEFGGAVDRENRMRTRGGVRADQDEDQTRLGCRRGAAGSRAVSLIKLMADANSAYTLADVRLKASTSST